MLSLLILCLDSQFVHSLHAVRASAYPEIRDIVCREMRLVDGDEASIDTLLNCGRFLYPTDEMVSPHRHFGPLLTRKYQYSGLAICSTSQYWDL